MLGGVGRHLHDLLTGLDPARFRQAAAVSHQRVDPRYLEAQPWPVYRLPLVRSLRPLSDLSAYRALLRLMQDLRPALVHAHSSKAGFLARAAASRLGLPPLYTPHAFPFQMPVSAPAQALFAALERWAARRGAAVIAVGEAERAAALPHHICPQERLVLIPNGIDVSAYAHLPGRAYRHQLGLPAGAELLLAVGELRTQKGHPLLLSAVSLLAHQRPGVHCLIAGEGPERPHLEEQIRSFGLQNRVSLLGRREDVPALLGATDVFVMTSLYEGCPYALLEALAAGTPVVALAAPGVDEILQHGHTGLLVPPGSPEALAAALGSVLDNPAGAAFRAEAARAEVRRRFSLDRMLQQTADLYSDLLAGRRV